MFPIPSTSGKELPTFKFELEKSEGRVMDGSYGKEATVEQLPISKGLAGVSMRMEPGVMRELHWHATAAEWAFVTDGRVRTTVIDPKGCSETNDFEPGDIWYFPRGHGHVIETLGDKPCHFILVFDNGYFSEFGTFSITDWMGHAPKELLAKNFGASGLHLRQLPEERSLFRQGQDSARCSLCPAAGLEAAAADPQIQSPLPEAVRDLQRRRRMARRRLSVPDLHHDDGRRAGDGAGRSARAALASERRRVAIRPRAANFSVTLFGSHGRWRQETLGQGDVGYIPQGFGHSIENIGDGKARILIVFNTGHYQTIDLSQWIAGNPTDVLATNFSQDASLSSRNSRARMCF